MCVLISMYSFLKVANLRQRFYNSIAPGGLAGDRRGVVPASGFSYSSQQIWNVIKENKDLDLPAHKVIIFLLLLPLPINLIQFFRTAWSPELFLFEWFFISLLQVMVATVRCEEIANEKFQSLCANEVCSCFDIFINISNAKMS